MSLAAHPGRRELLARKQFNLFVPLKKKKNRDGREKDGEANLPFSPSKLGWLFLKKKNFCFSVGREITLVIGR